MRCYIICLHVLSILESQMDGMHSTSLKGRGFMTAQLLFNDRNVKRSKNIRILRMYKLFKHIQASLTLQSTGEKKENFHRLLSKQKKKKNLRHVELVTRSSMKKGGTWFLNMKFRTNKRKKLKLLLKDRSKSTWQKEEKSCLKSELVICADSCEKVKLV